MRSSLSYAHLLGEGHGRLGALAQALGIQLEPPPAPGHEQPAIVDTQPGTTLARGWIPLGGKAYLPHLLQILGGYSVSIVGHLQHGLVRTRFENDINAFVRTIIARKGFPRVFQNVLNHVEQPHLFHLEYCRLRWRGPI